MNILLFSRIIAKSGVGNHMKQLAATLAGEGHQVVVVSSTNELNIDENCNVKFIKMKYVTSLQPLNILKGIKEIDEIIKQHQIDIVHCHHRMAALYMKFYNVFHSIPVVYTLHLADVPADFLHKTMTYVGDAAIGVSTEVSQFMIDKLGVPKQKVVTVLNGVDPNKLQPLSDSERRRFMNKYRISDGKLIFCMHSRIAEVKNHMLVVEAVHALPVEVRKRFVFLCSGVQEGAYYEKIAETIKAYGISDNFIFAGWAETRDIIGISNVLVLPSFNEGFALNVVEAFMLKKLVLRTKTAGFSDQKFCIPISADDPKVLCDLIEEISLNGFSNYSDRIEKSYDYAMKHFTINAMTSKTIAVYRKVLHAHSSGKRN